MQTILIPTDFSPIAREAIYYALAFTHKKPSKVILLHVFDVDYGFGFGISGKIKEQEEGKLEQLESLRQELKDTGKYDHIEFDIILHTGKLTYTALDVAEKNKVDLIVMGTKGQTDAHNQAFGSEAAKLINQTNIPLLAVPKGSKLEDLKHLFYATDYRERDVEVIGKLVNLARDFGANLHIIHIEEERTLKAQVMFRGFRDVIKEKFQYDKIIHELIVNERFLEGLASYVSLHEKAVLAMSYYKKGFFQSLFEDSKAEDMAYVTNVPLLVYQA